MTLVLAIIGALTGCIALTLNLLRFARERPQLVISFHVEAHMGSLPEVGLDVANRGGESTTIVKAALQADAETELSKDGIVFAAGKIEHDLSGGALATVAPGGVARFRRSVAEWPGMIHLDTPVRPYVVDSHGRTTWGEALPMMRLLVHTGWRPQGTVDPRLLESSGNPVTPSPVEPRWKLWKPRSLRKPSPLPRFPDPPPDLSTTVSGSAERR